MKMQAADQQVLNQVYTWLEQGQQCWLATVVATYGSSPRPVGSLMACNEHSEVVGSLSGGCVEDDLVEKLTIKTVVTNFPTVLRYGKDDAEATKFGLPCGGVLDIVIEPLAVSEVVVRTFDRLCQSLQNRRSIGRIVDLNTGKMQLVESTMVAPIEVDLGKGYLKQTFGPRYQLFIVGTNMVAEYVAEIAQKLDFLVTVIDTNQKSLDAFAVKGVSKVCDLPDEILERAANDENSAIVALSHDPRLDDMALLGAFETSAFYIGAMGSSRTSTARRDRLRELGVSNQNLKRLYAPIGIDTGSKTPPEIAISILAQITQIQYNKKQQKMDS